jgi:hypothetical protein
MIGPADEAGARRAGAGRARLLADLPFDAPDDLAGWIVSTGGVIAFAGFLLPWSRIVVGAANSGGYLDTWGFAVSSHLVAFGLVALTLALAFVPNRVPAWLRTGVLALFVGGLALGLAWPYVLVLPEARVGSIAVAIGGALLAVGGLLAVRSARHGGGGPVV